MIGDLLHLAALGATAYIFGPLLFLLLVIAVLFWLIRRPVR
jgi:hypothetical protein